MRTAWRLYRSPLFQLNAYSIEYLTRPKSGIYVCLFAFSAKRAATVGQGWCHGQLKAEMDVAELEVSGLFAHKLN